MVTVKGKNFTNEGDNDEENLQTHQSKSSVNYLKTENFTVDNSGFNKADFYENLLEKNAKDLHNCKNSFELKNKLI